MRRFIVRYHTKPCPGSAFYKGSIRVWAEDDEDAEQQARRELSKSGFDYPISHIIIDSVSREN